MICGSGGRAIRLARRRAAQWFFSAGIIAKNTCWRFPRNGGSRTLSAPGGLAKALAVEQTELHRRPEADFAVHASARADAVLIRDERTAAGGVSEADWTRIGELLDQSWGALSGAVRGKL